ncbi:hypothetical protein B0183_05850 [Glaesserella parasuis]|uniref:hypothetical protein n=4 Tax=Glaesserella parasuis TaxID=738 RepID=UPI00099333EC|nr:hypothetical protein [Glaesserella parasuis]MDE4032613.1 hypothetical protein [Glaesserella parasuis]MDG6302209.1 hypothetical protein [Glaesserella parasuis]MDG6377254.1 hypothetical protein [Glaesserella parasuis]MDP0356180.1 hypothetical protein [Glaesserella parasuis]OOR92051.1 hypothetical protein B0183_05850 [Glaesserella parasuis]
MTMITKEEIDAFHRVENALKKEQILAIELRGQVKQVIFQEKFLTFQRLQQLKQIKESKGYRNLPIVDDNTGEIKRINTFKEYCDSINLSISTVDNELLNLSVLGEELYQASVKLGLTSREMRRLRTLPDETIIDIRKIDFSEDEDKSRLVEKLAEAEKMVEKLSDTIEEQAETLKETTQKLEESQQNYEALSRVNENKDKRINQLDLDLQKSKQLIKTATPDELGAILREKASLIAYGIQAQIIAQLRPAFDELEKHSNETNIDHRQFMSGIIGQLYVEINEIQSYFNLNEFADGNNLLDWERGIFKKEDNEIDERMQAILDAEILG